MERVEMIQKALDHIEAHLTQTLDPCDIADVLRVPCPDLQTYFAVIVGYSLSEYIRNRRLYEAAKELLASDVKVIDIALKYGYEAPDSFSKAFYRFHGILPSKIRAGNNTGRVFRPITVNLSVNGGFKTSYRIDRRYGFKIIALCPSQKEKNVEAIWRSFFRKYRDITGHETPPRNGTELMIAENAIGEYGIYHYKTGVYMVAGRYFGGNTTEEFRLFEFEPSSWAVLKLSGPASRERIERLEQMMIEDISDNPEYRIKQDVILENYGTTVRSSADSCDECLIQIPVERISDTVSNSVSKMANVISILILLFALAVGGYKYQTKSAADIDTDVLYNLAQYTVNNAETERR